MQVFCHLGSIKCHNIKQLITIFPIKSYTAKVVSYRRLTMKFIKTYVCGMWRCINPKSGTSQLKRKKFGSLSNAVLQKKNNLEEGKQMDL